MKIWYAFFAVVLSTSCAGDIGGKKSPDNGGDITCETDANGIVATTVNASSEEEWVYFDFENCGIVDEATSGDDWDLAFKRFNPKINGGVSGSGGVEVAILDANPDFDAIADAPGGAYRVDVEDEDDDGVPEYAMKGWYDYDFSTHILTPADVVYVLKTTDGAYIKIRFDDYYDDDVCSDWAW